jgi:hypothetical protein
VRKSRILEPVGCFRSFYERPTYSVVPSNAIWRDPVRADVAAILHKNEGGNGGRTSISRR